jgi:hypothetical protein
MHRKDIMVYLYNPRKRFFHVVVELRDEGALPSLFSSLSQMGLSVMNAFTSPDGVRNRICSLFAEARGDRVTASQLKSILDSWPQSHFVRGHLCSYSQHSPGGPLSCVETKCLAAGHEHCEFHLSQAEAGRETSRL